MNQMDSSLIVETLSNSNGFTYHPVSWRTGGIYCAAFLYFTSFSFLFVPVTLLINDLITGEATNPNSESVTYSGLAYGFAALFKVLTVKYLGSFSDYIGRKPVGILLMVLHIVNTIRAKNLGRLGDRIQMLPELICNLWMMPACGQAWISVLVGFKF